MLKTLLGDYPVTKQFKTRGDRFDFAQFQGGVAQQFQRVVRKLEFDVAELALMTFLIAKAHGKPYRLLPFTVMARYQHPFLKFNPERTPGLKPEALAGKRIGVRSYSVTTGAWIRHILAEDFGVDLSKIRWGTFEEAHVAEFIDPANVQRAPAGNEIKSMLLAGALYAPILGDAAPDPRLQPLIADPEAAGKRWGEKHGAIQLNHLVSVKSPVSSPVSMEGIELVAKSKHV